MNDADIIVKGKVIDDHTRCIHYHSALDVIAIKFKCCNDYYPCFFCHQKETHHPSQQWKTKEFNTKAVLCGICRNELTIEQYLKCNSTCPFCNADFNPKCSNHYHFYFEMQEKN